VESTNCLACHRAGGQIPPGVRDVKGVGKRVHGPAVDEENGEPIPFDESESEVTLVESETDTTFSHARHKSIKCTTCHSTQRSHGERLVKRKSDCLACHHGASQQTTCTTCHAAASLPAKSQVVNVSMSVFSTPRTRTLPFDHDRHTRFECKGCHTTPLTLAAAKTCASCHTEHHGEAASCQSCHPATPITAQRAAHPRATIHDGCAGSGCHSDAAVLALPPARNVSVACHRELVDHKPGGDCASCHLVRWQAKPPEGGEARRGGIR
jgi:hypothetical protein